MNRYDDSIIEKYIKAMKMKKKYMHDELFTQAGLASVLLYLLDHDGSNQKTILENTRANTITINKIQHLLIKHKLITIKKGEYYNQVLYFITGKGRSIAGKILEIESLL